MAQLILSSRYIKNPKSANAGKLVKYMGTRDGVEKLPKGYDTKPATKRQQELIKTITNSYSESKEYIEYDEYQKSKTKGSATEFINSFIEQNADRAEQLKSLVTYMAERPSVEKLGTHGLFSETEESINLNEVADAVSNHDGIVFTHVFSLTRDDAERLGYNNANAWKELVKRNQIEIAAAHKIAPQDMQWYTAFHNTSYHPHIHMVVYSKSGRGYLTKNGILKMKSTFANDIFREERYSLFQQQTDVRNKLISEFNKCLDDFKSNRLTVSQELYNQMIKLEQQLTCCNGKKVYGYLPKKVKETVNNILKQMLNDYEGLNDLYSQWNRINNLKLSTYNKVDDESYIPIEENKEFRSIKNAIIKAVQELDFITEAEPIRNYKNSIIVSDVAYLLADMFNTSADKKINQHKAQSIDKKQLEKMMKEGKKPTEQSTKIETEQQSDHLLELFAMTLFIGGSIIIDSFENIRKQEAEQARQEELYRQQLEEQQRLQEEAERLREQQEYDDYDDYYDDDEGESFVLSM